MEQAYKKTTISRLRRTESRKELVELTGIVRGFTHELDGTGKMTDTYEFFLQERWSNFLNVKGLAYGTNSIVESLLKSSSESNKRIMVRGEYWSAPPCRREATIPPSIAIPSARDYLIFHSAKLGKYMITG